MFTFKCTIPSGFARFDIVVTSPVDKPGEEKIDQNLSSPVNTYDRANLNCPASYWTSHTVMRLFSANTLPKNSLHQMMEMINKGDHEIIIRVASESWDCQTKSICLRSSLAGP